MKVVLFHGRAGAGKSTQAKLLVEHYQENNIPVSFINIGHILRTQFADDSDNATLLKHTIASCMKKGGLLPYSIAMGAWLYALREEVQIGDTLVLDGAARFDEEALYLHDILSRLSYPAPLLIEVDVSIEKAWERLQKRKRSDDTLASFKERSKWYETNIVPTFKVWEKLGARIEKIDGHNDVDTMHTLVKSLL